MIFTSGKFYIYLIVLFFGFIASAIWANFEFFLALLFTVLFAILELYFSLKEIKQLEMKNHELNKAKIELDNYRNMGILRILENKDDTKDYSKRIENLNERLYVMGNTAHKLIEDFANLERQSESKRVLLQSLGKNIEVRLLLAEKEFLSEKRKAEFDIVLNKMKNISKKYNNFKVKYFNHEPTQSIFLFDDECFIGPIFKGLASHDTPALHMKCGGSYTKKYLNYFNNEWESAKELNVNE